LGKKKENQCPCKALGKGWLERLAGRTAKNPRGAIQITRTEGAPRREEMGVEEDEGTRKRGS